LKFDKLVRDRIPEIMRGEGERPIIHVAGAKEYRKRLTTKLKEETEEFCASESREELADILEVVYAICAVKKISIRDLEAIRKKKKREKGGFNRRIVLDRVD
jgi:predicted house-cleaning noncanonical NTP pyrophosphatase (MazG superfamily)